MRPPQENRAVFWAHVTAFGALWGMLEITLGAFVHTLQLPFSGVLLAPLSTALLVAQRQILPRRGATLATAAVAAICKSVSPGGVILGPMVGILSQGLLAEAALLLAPGALPSALLAGGLCALWPLCQKLLMQYLLYGASVVDVFVTVLSQAGDWMGLPASAGWWALLGLVVAIVALGAGGGFLGWRLGRDVRRLLQPNDGGVSAHAG